jgi:hypothetical protein
MQKQFSVGFLKGGLRDFPAGYPASETAFQDLCLLTSVIYSHSKLTNPESYHTIKKLLYSKSSKKEKNIAGFALEQLVTNLCLHCNLSPTGPYELNETLNVISEHLKIQIVVISSMDGSKPGITAFPRGFKLDRLRIYLIVLEEDHVMSIESLKTFFREHKKSICFGCEQFFSRTFVKTHRCKKIDSCFNCGGIFKTEETVTVQGETIFFCDSKLMSKQIAAFNCDECNLEFKSQSCFKRHKHMCISEMSGWKCLACRVFIQLSGKTREEVRSAHVCSETHRRCEFCFQSEEVDHICKIKPKIQHSEWPNLAFIRMKFNNTDSGNCQSCFEIRQTFAVENNLTLTELFKSESFGNLICHEHKNGTNNPKPNIISVFKEIKRNIFQEFIFTDDKLQIQDTGNNNTFLHNYCEDPKPMTSKTFKPLRQCQSVTSCFRKKLKNLISGEALTKLLYFICEQSDFSNYTFLTDEKSLVITKYFFPFNLDAKIKEKI